MDTTCEIAATTVANDCQKVVNNNDTNKSNCENDKVAESVSSLDKHDLTKSSFASNGDQEEEDSSKENKDEANSSSEASASDRQTATGGDKTSAIPNNKKKGSKNRWRPLLIEPQSSKQQERQRKQRSRRRENSQASNHENGSHRVEESETKNGAPERSYRGSRRGARGRGYSYGRSFRGRSRNYETDRSHEVEIQEDYSANYSYASTGAGYVTPTAVPAAFISPYYAPFTSLPTPTYDAETLRNLIRLQVEYYFSEENLQRDFFIRRKMDNEGYLPISLIASFQRVQALTQDVLILIDALKSSDELEISECNTKVRTKHEPAKWPIFGMKFQLSASETGASLTSNDSLSAINPKTLSDLHPDVPDFVPGQPYGYFYDGAPPKTVVGSVDFDFGDGEMNAGNDAGADADTETDEVTDKLSSTRVSCYADAVKTQKNNENGKPEEANKMVNAATTKTSKVEDSAVPSINSVS
ncbi:la-related protein 1B-like protein [Dinothrombium tinctorium]|uniref:La-related protein 1 n=1 Tax=Dinothrombium tinctorium TaxID=1965070 RepID=A0A3S3P7N2_9ACAR|nr:la-related protein 1B-like protein [Dinothrombium tinctorium]RWS13617.1 la-related protein 1B-like protein [Dinothrombium tinctorium]